MYIYIYIYIICIYIYNISTYIYIYNIYIQILSYIYIYVCVCVYVVMDNIKVWVSCKMQWRFQQKMCVVYHAQNCLLPVVKDSKTSNVNLLFYYHNCFLWIVSQKRRSYFRNCSLNLAVVHPEGFQGEYTGWGTQLCIQLMKNR